MKVKRVNINLPWCVYFELERIQYDRLREYKQKPTITDLIKEAIVSHYLHSEPKEQQQ